MDVIKQIGVTTSVNESEVQSRGETAFFSNYL